MAVKSVKTTGTTDAITGLGTATLKIPGTFSGIDPSLPTFQGRLPLQLAVYFAVPLAGDTCTDLRVEDTDLLIEAAIGLPATLAIFPLYPILRSTSDLAASSGNRGFYFPVQETFKIPPELKYKMVPSGCYLVADFAKATTVADTVYINIMWDDLT